MPDLSRKNISATLQVESAGEVIRLPAPEETDNILNSIPVTFMGQQHNEALIDNTSLELARRLRRMQQLQADQLARLA